MLDEKVLLYPIKFYPILKEKIWGGHKLLKDYNKDCSFKSKIGESWEISTVKNNVSVIKNGYFKGQEFTKVLNKYSELILGKKYKNTKKFPFLYKLIDATENLSVQVHPDDNFSPGTKGKTEGWYIVETENNSIVLGLPESIKLVDAKEYINQNLIKNIICYNEIKNDDFLFIPAGAIHAILKGTLIAEIQQSSDITYRIYDWDRNEKNRKLDIEKSVDCLKAHYFNELLYRNHLSDKNDFKLLFDKEKFSVYKIESLKTFEFKNDEFCILTNFSCDIEIVFKNSNSEILKKGDTVLIPANQVFELNSCFRKKLNCLLILPGIH